MSRLGVSGGGTGFLTPEEFAALLCSGRLDPSRTQFSQDSISSRFEAGVGAIEALISALQNGKVDPGDIPPIRIVVKDGKVFTLDNRRFCAFRTARMEIPFVRLDSIPRGELRKFSTQNDGVSIVGRPPRQ